MDIEKEGKFYMQNEKKTSEKVKNVVIIFLLLLVIALGVYSFKDKFILNGTSSKNDVGSNDVVDTSKENQGKTDGNVVKRDSFDLDYNYYIQNYLPILVGELYNQQTGFNLDNYKSDETIKGFIYSYYRIGASKSNLSNLDNYPIISINVKKSELDEITYRVFAKEGLDDYTLSIRKTFGIVKLDEENYKIVWGAVGDTARYRLSGQYVDEGSTKNENLIYKSSIWFESLNNQEHIGILKFTFKYNSEKQQGKREECLRRINTFLIYWQLQAPHRILRQREVL